MRKGRQPAKKVVNEQGVVTAANTAQIGPSPNRQPSAKRAAMVTKPSRQGVAPFIEVEGGPRRRPDVLASTKHGYSTYGTMENRAPTNDAPDALRQIGPSSYRAAPDDDAWADQAERRDGYPRPDRYGQPKRDERFQPTTASPRSVNIRDNTEPARGILESFGKTLGAEQVLPLKMTVVPTERLAVTWWFGRSNRPRIWDLPPEERGMPETPNT